MNNYVTEAINLKSYNLSESDKIILMYSKDKGLIKGVAKGIKKPKSKLGARMDLLVANSLQLLKGRSMDTILQAQTINNFRKTHIYNSFHTNYSYRCPNSGTNTESLNSSEFACQTKMG